MPVTRAVDAFRQKRLNCAQSVLHAFQPLHPVTDAEILQAREHGGGRAEAGRCGALHAALRIAGGNPGLQQRLHEQFVALAGSESCREIRRAKRLSCLECVRLAAHLLAENGKDAGNNAAP